MEFAAMVVIAALTFGVCFLVDKGYMNLFRSKVQHKSGLSVRLNKRYALIGLLLVVLGIAGLMNAAQGTALLIGGVIVLLMGAALVVYYMTFGIFYDEDSFVLTTFGKKSATYRFSDIKEQRLYMIQGGNVVIELHLGGGRAVSLQASMEGTYPFLDHAFSAWCRQTGRDPEKCDFHDPSKSLWFPSGEDV